MKRIILVILIAVFSAVSVAPIVVNATPVYEQKKDEKKKDPPGPANVKPKERDNKPGGKSSDRSRDKQDKPKKDKKPDHD